MLLQRQEADGEASQEISGSKVLKGGRRGGKGRRGSESGSDGGQYYLRLNRGPVFLKLALVLWMLYTSNVLFRVSTQTISGSFIVYGTVSCISVSEFIFVFKPDKSKGQEIPQLMTQRGFASILLVPVLTYIWIFR